MSLRPSRNRSRSAALAATTLAAATLLPAPAATGPAPRHVVLVPGIWDTFRKMQKLERAIRDAGLEPTTAELSPNNGRARLDVLAAQLDAHVARHVPPGARLSLVGFSMGGLVARSYLRQFVEPGRVATFISIASPHRGTWTAWLAGGPGVRDMRAGSAFLAALDADAPRHHATRWITFRTPLDLIILPSESSSLDWAENTSLLVVAHPLMVSDPRVIARVRRELTRPVPLPAPVPAF